MKRLLASIALLIVSPVFAMDPSASCFNQLDTHGALAPLREVIALGSIKGQTMDMMTNTRYPTPAEKDVIKVWVKERDLCLVSGENWRLEHMPANMRLILDEYYAKNKVLIADLYIGKISYGEFANKRAALSSELNAEMNIARHNNQVKRDAGSAMSAMEAHREQQRAASRTQMLEQATRIFDTEQPGTVPATLQPGCPNEQKNTGPHAVAVPQADCR